MGGGGGGGMGAPVKASRELARAVEDEAHRAQVDAAKKRAVGQLSDYDTFRNMVSVAHLRPLQAEGRADRAAGAAAWNFDGAGRAVAEPGPGSAAAAAAAAARGPTGPSEPPQSRDEFLAAWRRARAGGSAGGAPGGQRWALLRLCGAERVGALFRVEVEGKLLAEVVAAAAAALEGPGGAGPADRRLAAELLLALAGSARFGLAKALAGQACAGQAAEVLARVRDAAAGTGGDGELAQRAAEAFGVALPAPS